MNRGLRIAILSLVVCSIAPFLAAQMERPADANASVPALDSFHDVIREIWHEAFPKKDTALLRKLQPEVEKGISQVAAAPLPGILREQKDAWQTNVRKLQAIGEDYKTAVRGNDDAALLTAAEKLHGQYEALVRTIRPALKELDAFHSTLYMLYHHYLPAFDAEKIKSAAAQLKGHMADLNQARLPERLKTKETAFTSARSELSRAVDEFSAVALGSGDKKKVEESAEKMHSSYEKLNSVLE